MEAFTKIPNIFFDNTACLSNAEFRILAMLMRKTLGWHKKEDKISYTQLSKFTGLSLRIMKSSINHLIEIGCIERKGNCKSGYIYTVTMELSSIEESSIETTSIELVHSVPQKKQKLVHSVPPQKKEDKEKKDLVPKTIPKEITLFKKAQLLMEEIHGETFLNYKKEMPCLKRFIAQIEQKYPADPWPLVEGMIYQFAELKQEDRTAKGYWREMDFTPSKLIANAESIYEKFKQRTKEEKIDTVAMNFIKGMFKNE